MALCSTSPARILGVAGGTLAPGSIADITVYGERQWTVDARTFHSLGKNTPFDGRTFTRRALVTIVGGDVVYEHGRIFSRTMTQGIEAVR